MRFSRKGRYVGSIGRDVFMGMGWEVGLRRGKRRVIFGCRGFLG